MSGFQDAVLHPKLRLFVRNWVETYQLRRTIKTVRLLPVVFANARNHQANPLPRPPPSSHLEQRRLEFQEQHELAGVVLEEEDPDVSCSSSSDAEQVTVEAVVRHLHAQLECITQESVAKDRRIQDLELRVIKLAEENQSLHRQLAKYLKAPKTNANMLEDDNQGVRTE